MWKRKQSTTYEKKSEMICSDMFTVIEDFKLFRRSKGCDIRTSSYSSLFSGMWRDGWALWARLDFSTRAAPDGS